MNEYRLSEIDTISASVGKIILLWGAIESCLSGITIGLLIPTNNPPKNDGVPVSFSKKITLLKRCYRDNPRMSPIKEEARQLLIKLKPMHETRVIVSHGDYQGILGDGQHMFIAYQGGRSKRHGWHSHYFRPEQLDALAKELLEIEKAVEALALTTARLSSPPKD